MLQTKYLSSWPYGLFLEDFLSFSFRLPWQPEFCMELISFSKFERAPPKEHCCEVSLKLAKRLRRRCHLKQKVRFPYISLCKTGDPQGVVNFDPRGKI